jgi:hypothetical protein
MTEKINCLYCKERLPCTTIPDVGSSLKAVEYFKKANPTEEIMPYCTVFNKNNDCKFIKLNLKGLLKKY